MYKNIIETRVEDNSIVYIFDTKFVNFYTKNKTRILALFFYSLTRGLKLSIASTNFGCFITK